MPRFIPPHLLVLVVLLTVVVWFMLLHHFRRNGAMHKFVAETFGDNTPENALRAFELAKNRLEEHLQDNSLDHSTRQHIEVALGLSPDNETNIARAGHRSL